MERCDLVIQGAMVVDGTGTPAVRADVAVRDGLIVAVGDDVGPGAVSLDGSGRVLAPGFIDAHAHDDRAVLATPDMTPKLSQGVTTVIGGNCGLSIAPLDPPAELPAPFPLIGEPSDFRYPSVQAYRAALEASPPAINIALLVGHTTLRVGAVADLDREATAAEVDAMRAVLATALQDGCVGLSSGVDYEPAAAAPRRELEALVDVVGDFPAAVYATHVRDEGDGVLEAVDEAIVTAAGRAPLVLSHHKCAGPANYGRSVETLARIDSASDVALDVYPYVASSTSLMSKFVRDAEAVRVMWSDPCPEMAGRFLAEIAGGWGCTVDEACERLDPAGAIYFQIDEGDLRRILTHERSMIGSDGIPLRPSPHPRLWGTFPRVLGHYVRDTALLDLPTAVYKMTGLVADRFGLADRGVIEAGKAADLVLFDPASIADRATYDDPEQPAAGIDTVVVAGELAWHDGQATGSRTGRFLTRGAVA